MLRGTIFDTQLHHFYKIGSTNTAAMAAAAEGAAEGSVFLAEEQTAGRGRGAHSWESARSTGIYCSVVLRPALPPSEVLVLALAAGLAVRAAIEQVDSRVSPDLKWPNDVLIERQESMRHSHRDERRGHARALCGRRNRNQRKPGKFSQRIGEARQRRCEWRPAANGREWN